MAEEVVYLGPNINFEVHIHPLVIIQILDFYYRKVGALKDDEQNKFVAGALLGVVFTNRVHITNCFAIYAEKDADYVRTPSHPRITPSTRRKSRKCTPSISNPTPTRSSSEPSSPRRN